jgi:hypothetical protein
MEQERLTLAPAVELIDPSLGKLDWLMLPAILEREAGPTGGPPPIFAMFNVLKADFILARDLIWRTRDESTWPTTGRFSDTLDFAKYGPSSSAMVLAHRAALDLLDKVGVTANYYFELGQAPEKISFGKMWRTPQKNKSTSHPLLESVATIIREGVHALYGLVELADDYDSVEGILRSQKNLRNAGTHRFVVLHDIGDAKNVRLAPEVEHYSEDAFYLEVLRALRVARSAIQMLALSISQREQLLSKKIDGLIGTLNVPDHDWIRGRDEDS